MSTKKLSPPTFLHSVPHLSFDCRPHVGKKLSLIASRQILAKILPVEHIFSFIITTCLKTFWDYLSELYPLYAASYQKFHPPFILLDVPTMYGLPCRFSKNSGGNLVDRGVSCPAEKKNAHFHTRKICLH